MLGFLNPITNHLVTYNLPPKTNMNSELFITYMNDFVSKISQRTIVIIDNASYHKSNLTKSMFEEWETKGLYILLLPPKSPHLNLIEILWRKIKYEWLAIRDYRSENTLLKKLKMIFKKFGSIFNIAFSTNNF